mgnify:CR=1 FL=1
MVTSTRLSKMKYNIPKQFNIGGQEIKVRTMKHIGIEGAIGVYKSLSNEILVQTHMNGKPMAVSQVEQTYHHELIHCLFDHARQEDLCCNEELVDLMGELLYQVNKSSK